MVYVLGWLVNYIGLAAEAFVYYRGRFFLLCSVGVFAAIAFFRGSVGTDTYNYEVILSGFSADYVWEGLEPGFVALSFILLAWAPTPEAAVRLIALVFFGLVSFFVVRSDYNERYLLLVYLLPAFAYQYSMNVLRIGLGSAFLLLAIQQLRRCGSASALRFGAFAPMFHYSSVFSLVFIAFSQRSWFKLSTVAGVFFLLLALGISTSFIDLYLVEKFVIYREMGAPSGFSGLSKVVPILIIAVGVLLSCLPVNERLRIVTLGVGLALGGWLLAKYTYAGLRLLDLVSFAMPCAVLASFARLNLQFSRSLKVMLAVAGALSVVALGRSFALEAGQGDAPFLPYKLFCFWVI